MQVNRSGLSATRKSIMALLLAGVGMSMIPGPAMAQQESAEARLRKVEAELRALQRAVFPGGDGRYFTPEVDTSTPQQPRTTTTPAPAPSNTVLTDALTRLDSLEGQIARLTARNEESANHIAMLEAQIKELQEGQGDGAGGSGFSPVPSTNSNGPAFPPPRNPAPTPTPSPGTRTGNTGTLPAASNSGSNRPATTPASTTAATNTRNAPTAGRVAAIAAITKPSTGDAGEDEYSYGFRLWEAGFFPEAQQALSSYVTKYPRHARISYGRNLLGRAYLDNGQPREAATHFFENYQSDKQGARAGDSLLYLAESMVAIGDTNRACIALAEFSDSYQALATGRLKEQYDRDKNKVRCS